MPPRGIPAASERGAKSEVAHKWARWLHHPCRLGGSPPLQSGGHNQKWPTSGQGSYITPATSGDPHRFRAGGQNQKWPTSGQGGCITPAGLGDSHRFRAEGRIRSGPQVGKVATSPLPPRGSPPLQSGGQNQKWPTSGQGSYITLAAFGDPHRFRAGGQNQKWATSGQGGCITPAASGDSHRFRAEGKIRSGPQVGKVATSPLPPRGSPPLQSGGQNQKWPTSGEGSYITLAAFGDPHRFRAGGQNQKWPTSGQGGYITPAASGDPHRFRAGGKTRSGPQVGKAAT